MSVVFPDNRDSTLRKSSMTLRRYFSNRTTAEGWKVATTLQSLLNSWRNANTVPRRLVTPDRAVRARSAVLPRATMILGLTFSISSFKYIRHAFTSAGAGSALSWVLHFTELVT